MLDGETLADRLEKRALSLDEAPKIAIQIADVLNAAHHRGIVHRPWAFTEHGALMAVNILRSKRAGHVSVFVVRAFVRLRALLATHKELDKKLAELERRVESHDEHIQSLFEAIRRLMTPPRAKPRRIGFRASLRSS